MTTTPRTNEAGSALLFTVSIMALLAALAWMLTSTATLEAKRIDRYYRKLQARELSLAGLERGRALAAHGAVTNATYALGNGTVEITLQAPKPGQYHLLSTGRVTATGSSQPITVQTEVTIP